MKGLGAVLTLVIAAVILIWLWPRLRLAQIKALSTAGADLPLAELGGESLASYEPVDQPDPSVTPIPLMAYDNDFSFLAVPIGGGQ